MEPILVDTSVWIDWFNDKATPQTQIVESYLLAESPLVITPTILQEVLQGIRADSYYSTVQNSLMALTILSLEPVEAALGAADLYRKLRKSGITIRKANDCIIAFYAIKHKIPLLHNDTDFQQIAKTTGLKEVESK